MNNFLKTVKTFKPEAGVRSAVLLQASCSFISSPIHPISSNFTFRSPIIDNG